LAAAASTGEDTLFKNPSKSAGMVSGAADI
jgi:hypothetical protein